MLRGMKLDDEVRREIARELPYSHRMIVTIVAEGWVILEGDVEWRYQASRAAAAALRTSGVKGVLDFIAVKPQIDAGALHCWIEDALGHGDTPLDGLRSWGERQAQRTA
jgi:osmotically-inducible protein OsmY